MSSAAVAYSSDCREEPPKATWKLNSDGIDFTAFKNYIANLPERTVCNVRRMNVRTSLRLKTEDCSSLNYGFRARIVICMMRSTPSSRYSSDETA